MHTSNTHTGIDNRLYSLDALRGFDMLWITGGDALFIALAKLSGSDWLKSIAAQMDHVAWGGFHFYDLIFPLFMFISGVAIPLSVSSQLKRKVSKKSLFIKAFKRMIILIILGLLYNGVFRDGFSNARYASILGQIGVAYFFTSIIVIFSTTNKTRLFWLAGILIGVAILQLFIPVPGIGAGILTPEGHINGYIDRILLPGRLAYGGGTYDALGILSIISAIGITLMGTFAAYILQQKALTEYRKTAILTVIGVALITIALIISPLYPIIKKCWTTSFNLLAGGISFLLIALFYLVIDVWRIRKWSFYFRVIGLNSIFVYLFTCIVPVNNIIEFFIGWIVKPLGETGNLVMAVANLFGVWLLLYLMYRKNVFIKV